MNQRVNDLCASGVGLQVGVERRKKRHGPTCGLPRVKACSNFANSSHPPLLTILSDNTFNQRR